MRAHFSEVPDQSCLSSALCVSRRKSAQSQYIYHCSKCPAPDNTFDIGLPGRRDIYHVKDSHYLRLGEPDSMGNRPSAATSDLIAYLCLFPQLVVGLTTRVLPLNQTSARTFVLVSACAQGTISYLTLSWVRDSLPTARQALRGPMSRSTFMLSHSGCWSKPRICDHQRSSHTT